MMFYAKDFQLIYSLNKKKCPIPIGRNTIISVNFKKFCLNIPDLFFFAECKNGGVFGAFSTKS